VINSGDLRSLRNDPQADVCQTIRMGLNENSRHPPAFTSTPKSSHCLLLTASSIKNGDFIDSGLFGFAFGQASLM